MDDVIYTGYTEDVVGLNKKINWSSAIMILEKIPMQWLNDEERKNGICFKKFNKDENLNSWHKGRIFDYEKELCWSSADNKKFQVVYTGKDVDLEELKKKHIDNWEKSQSAKYFVWGKKFDPDELDNTYLELKIPRLLAYPIPCNKNKGRLTLSIVEYKDQKSGKVEHFRFMALEEA